jgi:hypothetical protein
MRFATALQPCPGCGDRERGDDRLDLSGSHPFIFLRGTCPRCGTELAYRFQYGARNPFTESPPPAFHLGGDEPSRIITPYQFLAEVDQLAPSIVWEPEALGVAAWKASGTMVSRIATCFNELLKFVVGADMPAAALDDAGRADRAARPERYQRAWLEAERDRYAALLARRKADAPRIWALDAIENPPPPPPRGELSSRTLEAHQQWVWRGRTGEGRLDIAHVDASRARIGAKDLSGARLEGVRLEGADASYSTFEGAELIDVRAAGANLGSCSFVGARLVRCDLASSNLALARLGGATITSGRWDQALLDRAACDRARFEGTSLRNVDINNARLDNTVFADCDFRGANFALRTPQPPGTTRGTRFERCDLRETRWTDRDLTGASFVDCRFRGITGVPSALAMVRIERPDLSPAGDGSAIGTPEDVIALWHGGHDT